MEPQKIVKALNGVLNSEIPVKTLARQLVIDSRNVECGDIFAAFSGENTDGNLFAAQALEKGAALVIVDNRAVYETLNGNKVLVANVLDAIKSLGLYKLAKYKGTKIAITGSMGKTSTKELISSVLRTEKKVYTAHGNYNNELGVAIVTANLELDSDYAIFEIGTNSFGEIEQLATYLKPTIAVLTAIGHAHIGKMGTIENLAKEKLSIIKGLNEGVLWVHSSCKKFLDKDLEASVKIKFFGAESDADVSLTDLARNEYGQLYFTATYKSEEYCFKINHPYDHFVSNALVAIGIGFDAKLEYKNVLAGILNFNPVAGRGALTKIGDIKIIDDTYNAGYESIISAIKNLDKIESNAKYALIGEMGEIEGFEETLYAELFALAKELKNINFIFVGKAYEKFEKAENINVALTKDVANEIVSQIKEGLILIKASRAKKFEDFISFLEQGSKKSAV